MEDNLRNHQLSNYAEEQLEKVGIVVRKMDEVLQELINISNGTGDLSVEDLVAITIFRKALDKCNAVFAISNLGVESSVQIVLRNLLELLLGTKYLLECPSEFKQRANQYYLCSLKDKIHQLKLYTGKKKGMELSEILKNMSITEDQKRAMNQEIIRIEKRIKAHEGLSQANKSYQQSSNSSPKWYSLNDGPESLHQLAKKYSYTPEYLLLYQAWSREAHGVNATDDVLLSDGEGGGIIRQVTSYTNIDFYINMTAKYSALIMLMYVKFFYSTSDQNSFLRWYERTMIEE
ncbi:hypothetical protein DH09_08290 [Bacillaceae bacterium JMAK1]|nr:hypothetical protein DH09_08290 [Bacillaceae bacterium JMAK1]